MLFYSFYKRRKKLFLLNLFFGVVSLLIFFYFHNLSEIIISDFSYEQYFTAFGAEIGLSFFYFLIGLIGLFSIWKRRRGHHYFLMTIFLFFILSLFNSVAKIFLNFFLSVLSAIFLLFLIKRTWAVPNIKRFTLLLIICGVIFSTALYSDQLIKSKPGKELVKGLVFLKDEPTAVVLSHEKNNFFIEYFSNKKTLLQSKDSEQIREKIFVSRNLKETTAMLNDKRINYILITGEMKEGLVWDKPQEGLLFLLENSKHFSKKYHSNEVEIWFFLD
jgi:signal transduction histidine kinase|tara:strand:- start:4368 stop:5189 length:822 start_codon:yes stop_codon:yes gene_type:complete